MITGMPRIAIAVDDYAAAVATFRDRFGMSYVDLSDRTVPDLGAHVGMCVPQGGSNIELMAPSDPEAPLSQSLQRFLDRRGAGLYALMLEAPDPNAEAEDLATRGIDVLPLMAGAGGRDIHPRSTHGVLIRVYPVNSAGDLSGPAARPGLSGIGRAIIVTEDADAAAKVYGHGFGLEVGPVETDERFGLRRAICRPATGGVIELVSPGATPGTGDDRLRTALRTRLDERGPGMYGLVLEAADVDAEVETLGAGGLTVVPAADGLGNSGGSNSYETTVFGARLILVGG